MELKLIMSIAATTIAVISYIPYIRDIRLGKTKPHVFSWIIWALIGYIAGFAQIAAGGGTGSFVALVTATISLLIAIIALNDGSVKITKGDWISFLAAMSAIPIWVITKQPLISVIIVCLIDLLAFWPTMRKSFDLPNQETLSTQILSTTKHLITIAALQNYNLITVLYPFTLAITNAVFIIELIMRRAHYSNQSQK
ncbi:MAG TPA: hypothetical protein VM077_00075 [Candidatus Limnocylindrales bacterium]|nr:hypothetical protein [Candidatus Limnocylindrales bacterium]